jgi:hypothetical protein
MVRHVKTQESSVFRFMCIRNGNTNYHKDFGSKEEVQAYADALNDSKIEWYGIYELRPDCNYPITLSSTRLQPHNNSIIVKKEEKPSTRKRRYQNSTSKKLPSDC